MSFYKKVSVLLILSFPLFFILICFCTLDFSTREQKDLSDDPYWSHLMDMELETKEPLLLVFAYEKYIIHSFGSMSLLPKSPEEFHSG